MKIHTKKSSFVAALLLTAFAAACATDITRKPYRIVLEELPPSRGLLIGNPVPLEIPQEYRSLIALVDRDFRAQASQLAANLEKKYQTTARVAGTGRPAIRTGRIEGGPFLDYFYDQKKIAARLARHRATFFLVPVYYIVAPRRNVFISQTGNIRTECPNQPVPEIDFYYLIFGPTGELAAVTNEFVLPGITPQLPWKTRNSRILWKVESRGVLCATRLKDTFDFAPLFHDIRLMQISELFK